MRCIRQTKMLGKTLSAVAVSRRYSSGTSYCLIELVFYYEVPQVPQILKLFSFFCGTFGTRKYLSSLKCASVVAEIISATL